MTAMAVVIGLLVATNLVLFALAAKANPRVIGDVLNVAVALVAVLAFTSLTDRVKKLERATGKTDAAGQLTAMVTDAKAAARLSGYDEAHVDEVAKEVLTACIRSAGGWKA
jgi:hypothetical protein